jgi:intracellular multiplication protein IcmJ
MYPIELSAKQGAWRLFAARKADVAFLDFSKKVWSRDDYTCQFCGFQAKDYQEVINLDQNYLNNRLSNLVTACCFCAQCFFLEAVGRGDYGGGLLIYLPEIDQSSLNSFCHVLFCAIGNNTTYKSSAQSIYRNFKFRNQPIEEVFGEGMSNPSVFGQLMLETRVDSPALKEAMLKNIRLLPSLGRFKVQIEHWASNALKELLEN